MNFKTPSRRSNGRQTQRSEANTEREDIQSEMSFLKVVTTPGTDGVIHEEIKCYQCNKRGHYSGQYPTLEEGEPSEGVQLV